MNLDKIITMFSTKEFPEQLSRTLINRLDSDAPIPALGWSISNQLLLMAQGTMDARTEKAWKDVGRTVIDKSPSKKVWILCPNNKEIEVLKDDNTKEKKIITVGYFMGWRWAVENTEGKELAKADYTPVNLPPLMEVAEKWGIKVEYIPHDKARGCYGYATTNNEIYLCTTEAKTFFHELAHQAHRKIDDRGWLDKERAEIIAELSAATLCLMYGITGYERYSFDYIAHFAKGEKNLLTKVSSVLNDVEKILKLILGYAEEKKEASASK